MKAGMTYPEYINFINHLFMQRLVDFDYYENADCGSTHNAMEIL